MTLQGATSGQRAFPMNRRSLIGVLLLALGGCASLQPEPVLPELAEAQAFVNQVAKVYGRRLEIPQVLPARDKAWGGMYVCCPGVMEDPDKPRVTFWMYRGQPPAIFLNRLLLKGQHHKDLYFVLAHEVSHWLLGHGNQLGWKQMGLKEEQEANFKAVEVLQRVRGMSREAAAEGFLDHLSRGFGIGPHDPGAEIADLMTRLGR